MNRITPYLWFDKGKAFEAVEFYKSIFQDVKIIDSYKFENNPTGEISEITVEINGQRMIFLDVGPGFEFTEAISFVVECDGQKEVDYYWEKLASNGGYESNWGWLKDRYGLSWQVVPKQLYEIVKKDATGKVTEEILKMNKIIIEDLEKALS